MVWLNFLFLFPKNDWYSLLQEHCRVTLGSIKNYMYVCMCSFIMGVNVVIFRY